MIDRLYPAALDCGMTSREFWNASLAEIMDVMDSYSCREERRLKERLSGLHFLAKDIAQSVGLVFGGKEGDRVPELWDYFPDLFERERESAETIQRQQELAVYKAQMSDFAYRHNYAQTGGEESRKE